jgi:dihydroorotate dehydrogenase
MYKKIIRPTLFRYQPETAHHMTMAGLTLAGKIPGGTAFLRGLYGNRPHPALKTSLFGIEFHTPIGLAAGLDKNGEAIPAFSNIGFGFIEVGTVTPKAQPGNEKPRSFRLPSDKGLINRMGFNNEGIVPLAEKIDALKKRPIPIAVNIGKNKVTPNEDAISDYLACMTGLYAQGDFFVVNISSPNTPDLRKLQHGDDLEQLLKAVKQASAELAEAHGLAQPKSVLVKIAPDLTPDELESIVATAVRTNIDGIIATNTTLSREGLTHPNQKETGGLSGLPVKARSTEVIRSIYRLTNGKMPIIGVGGIFTAEDAYEKILAGASMVEVYTGLIYEGPKINRNIQDGLLRYLARDGYATIADAVGKGNA